MVTERGCYQCLVLVSIVRRGTIVTAFASGGPIIHAQQVSASETQLYASLITNGTMFGDAHIENGTCYHPKQTSDLKLARKRCLDLLLSRKPQVIMQTPGSFFVGKAWGSKDEQIVFGPAAGLVAAFVLPVVHPLLDETSTSASRDFEFKSPETMEAVLDVAISMSANITGVNFREDAPMDATDAEAAQTQLGFSAGIFVGIQPGLTWFENGNEQRRLMLSLGVLAAFLGKVDRLGNAFLLGFQPALVVAF